MPLPWTPLAALTLLMAPQEGARAWPPKGAPEMTAVFRVMYQEKGHPYVDETYYVDLPALRKLWYQTQVKTSPLELLRTGQLWCCVRMKFLVDISGPKRRAGVERNLRECWPEDGFELNLPELGPFLEWQGRELNFGDRVEYCFIPGKGIEIRFNEGPSRRFTSPRLVQAVKNIEFTDDPTDPGAMADLASALRRHLQ